jgi:hypothetical protein
MEEANKNDARKLTCVPSYEERKQENGMRNGRKS